MEQIVTPLAHAFFVRLFFTPLRYPAPEKEKRAASFAETFSFTIDGHKICAYSWGKGLQTIIMVHGWAGRATQFRRFIKPLTQAGFRVIAFDGPAHGQSGGKRATLQGFEAALKKLFEITDTPDAIIAHSFGGAATLFAAMNGLPVKKLINIATPAVGDDIINAFVKAVRGTDKTRLFFKDYVERKTGKSFDEFTALHFLTHLPSSFPLLLIHDEADREVPFQHAHEMLRVYPQAKLYPTSGLGHTRLLKDDRVIEECVTFVTADTST